MAVGALAGLTVVDLSRVLAGPYCTQLLGDHGARIVKVEPPDGDGTRAWGPPYTDGVSAYYAGLNRNKELIAVDLNTSSGRELVLRLIADADVLVENFKPGTMERWGLGAEDLLTRFPELVYCRITAFGVDGPMGGLPGYDAVLQAYAGIMDMNGESDGGPIRVPMPIVDLTTGMLAFSGVLLALHERAKSGRGQLVDLSLLDCAVSLLHPAAANYFMTGTPPQRIGTAHPNIAPCETFAGPDGPIYVAGGNDAQFRALCAYLGAEQIADDPRFATNTDRVVNRAALADVLAERFAEASIGYDKALDMISKGISASVVRPLDQALADPQVAHRNMVEELGSFRMLGIPIKLARTPGSVHTPPRRPGADTRSILTRAGFTLDAIDELLRDNVVRAEAAP